MSGEKNTSEQEPKRTGILGTFVDKSNATIPAQRLLPYPEGTVMYDLYFRDLPEEVEKRRKRDEALSRALRDSSDFYRSESIPKERENCFVRLLRCLILD